MNWNKRDIVFILIILCLAVGWFMAVTSQTTSVAHVKKLYNHLVSFKRKTEIAGQVYY
jgi:ABC-type nickel/cobalt efflux system permease component RcnA